VAVTATDQATKIPGVETVLVDSLPGVIAGRRFQYAVAQNILDRNTVSYLLEHIFELLEDGGQAIFIESNPWNPLSALRRAARGGLGQSHAEPLLSRTQLYELLSEIGFIRIFARFTDFLYRPLVPTARMAWIMRNASVLLENMPLVRNLAGRIVLHAQKPPRAIARPTASLCRHDNLRRAVSFVIPCHNEEMNLQPLVDGLRNHYGGYVHQIVLVNDNSRDNTASVINRLAAADGRIVPVHRTPPNGVGHALRDGYAATSGRWVMSMDCDFQHLLPEMEDMFDAAARGTDVVLGSRFSRHSVLINYPFGKILANRSFHMLANLAIRLGNRRDITNNLKLMRGDLARQLVITEPWFAANAEIGLQVVLLGRSIQEVPISWMNRTFDMGHSSFKVLKFGTGYVRVLWRFARATRFGHRPLSKTAPVRA
jgi:dolichol-phosphate mannosyltransferase